MEPNEEHVQTLLTMGFSDVNEIRKALRLGRNDVNEAVAILTNEQPGSNFDTLDDVEMKDVQSNPSTTQVGSPGCDPPPPSYDETVEPVSEEDQAQNVHEATEDDASTAVSNEFPTTNLYELEGRVFTEQWSIPYKREESLGKCLLGATRLAQEGLMEADENCMRFVERCMPEAFKKLLSSAAVHRWGTEIQEGIYNMLQLLIDLIAVRLKYDPVSCSLLNGLGIAFDPETEFHFKNRARRWDRVHYEDVFGANQTYAVSPPFNTYKEPYGWLVNLINRFAEKSGFESARQRMLESTEELDAPLMAALLFPFGLCAEYLNAHKVSNILQPMMEKAIKYVQGLEDNDLRHKKSGSVSDLLSSMKLLCMHLWTDDVTAIDDLRLEIALKMLKSPHFNAKMNSLKEVTKLIDDSSATRAVKNAIPSEKILDWLVDNKILSIALEGNIDQSQYCDKIKGIVEFLGSRLLLDELTKIWRMQNGQNATVIDNIHSIMAAAAVKFSGQQLEHLFSLIQKSWQIENDRMREKLLSLIGKIGRDARVGKTTTKVLELLWDLAHLPALPLHLIEQALDEHLSILSDSFSVKEQVKKSYVIKCVDDIKKGVCVVPALRQLHQISRSIVKQTYNKEKGILHELNKNYEVVKLVTQSLVKCHKLAVCAAKESPITADTMVDGRHTHQEFIISHLKFLGFILQEGMLYLPWHRAREIWDCLVSNPDACEFDRETCLDWFTKGLFDLEAETQQQMFTQKLLKLDPAKLSMRGFACVKTFFENVNLYDHRLKKTTGTSFVVDKLDLYGIEFMWQIALETPNEEIAHIAVKHLLHMCYSNLSPRLKKDPVSLHKKFITECYKRLEEAMITLGGSALAIAISRATKTLTAATIPEVAALPSPSRSAKLLIIERLLLLAEKYVTTVEDYHSGSRTILPHGASFQGQPLVIHLNCETPKGDFTIMGHSNETLQSVRLKIADHLKTTPENVQIAINDKIFLPSKDQKLLHQLEFDDEQILIVKSAGAVTQANQARVEEIQEVMRIEEAGNLEQSRRQAYVLEQEKMLPGVVMAMGGHVFEMLYQLAELDEPKIRSRVRSLLMLIPTDPAVHEALESIGRHIDDNLSTSDDSNSSSKDTSPKAVLENLFNPSAPGMSAFRVLYNLEVLSGKLMPTVQDMTSTTSKLFCDNFLNASGLSFVVNVLQKDSVPSDVDYVTRQGCYSVCLQLARFLLCGQSLMGHTPSDVSLLDDEMENGANISASSSKTYSASPAKQTQSTEKNNKETDEIPSAVKLSIQTMSVTDFTATLSCFMRLTWAAAAGRIHLASSSQHIGLTKDGSLYGSASFHIGQVERRRSRHSSTGSTGSGCSDHSDIHALFPGVCAIQHVVSTKDSRIAREALELLVRCLQLRTDLLGSFYALPFINDFIIDILLGSASTEVRNAALEQFDTLGAHTMVRDKPELQNPRYFLLQVLLKAHVPLWTTSTSVRGTSQRLLGQCSQYFELRCRLLEGLSKSEQTSLQINAISMLEDEIAWFDNFESSDQADLLDIDEILLTGHLRLMTILFTCEGVDKRKYGKSLVSKLLNEFLFPASKLILAGSGNDRPIPDAAEFVPKCSHVESRIAAFEMLVVLADGCLDNLQEISRQLLSMHHKADPSTAKEWEYLPPVAGRPTEGFVGLRNAGATCYMNSVIQQLYMTPELAEKVLSIEVNEQEEENIFYEMQRVFGHLMESKLQYHVPEKFWNCFKLWGQPVNVREQQDAFEFFTDLTDQLDEYLKKMKHKEIFKPKFQGIFSDQKICKDCPHRYEREEPFFALNLTVKSHNLESSLEQFVRGEMLEGDNAYYCEKCGEKRNTIKRLCIKTLPPVLVIQLKRFGYDWEANRALKFDDYFQFPWVLDMEPYTVEGVARREVENDNNNETEEKSIKAFKAASYDDLYQLVGIVVHSGQANAGHYYSFIRDRRGTSMTNATKGKWFKFNDTIVEEFDMNDGSVEAECFGGTYRAKVYDQSNSYPETRQRYWNGYMLYYEKTEGIRTPETSMRRPPPKQRAALLKQDSEGDIRVVSELSSPECSPRHDSDGLSLLTELVRKGDKKGLFTDKMPASVQQEVRTENLRYIKNKGVHNVEYFKFVRQLVWCNLKNTDSSDFDELALGGLKLAVQFLFNTYFRTKKKLRQDIQEWCSTIHTIVSQSKKSCFWFIEYLSSPEGNAYIKPFLLESPTREVRMSFCRILEDTLRCFFNHGGNSAVKSFDDLMEFLLLMLDKDVPDNCKTCTQYFLLINVYANMGMKACKHLFVRNAFRRLLMFLLGPPSSMRREVAHDDLTRRRWTSSQTKDFGPLHSTLAVLVLHCDISSQRIKDAGEFSPRISKQSQPLLPLPEQVKVLLFQQDTYRYIREAVLACREVNNPVTVIEDVLLYCCFCNESFSVGVLMMIKNQITAVPANELKSVFSLLMELLLLEDPLQLNRLKWAIDGTENDGLLAIIRSGNVNDSRRAYQCLKFLVTLANKCTVAKEYLMESSTRWQWAVNWLKKKMTDYYWSPHSTVSNDSSSSKTFQRTESARDTLAEATALLSELESQENAGQETTMDDNGTEETQIDYDTEGQNDTNNENMGDLEEIDT